MIYRQYIMTDRPVVQCQYAEVRRKMVDEETKIQRTVLVLKQVRSRNRLTVYYIHKTQKCVKFLAKLNSDTFDKTI